MKKYDTRGRFQLAAAGQPDGHQPAAFPNPFGERTTIAYEVRETTRARSVIYDKNGTPVKGLVDPLQPAGRYAVLFEAANLPKGLYAYRLQTGMGVKTKKLRLVK